MRQETNNEIDLLLRRLGRRQDTPASSDHLDADELNSYAENALPPAARAHYTEHLADCARCRSLVVQLSSSAGVVVAQESVKVSEPSVLRKFLASLLSPMVLRYAVPALGLVVVAAIGFTVLRNEGSLSPVGMRPDYPEPVQTAVPASQPQPSSSPEHGSQGYVDTTKSVNKPSVQGDVPAERGAAAAPPPNAPPVVGTITTEVQDQDKKVEQQQAEAKEAAPAPKATPTVEPLKKLGTEAAKQSAVAVAAANEAEKAKTQDTSVATGTVESSSAARSRAERRDITALRGAGAPATKREDDAAKDKYDADTRTVAGRNFRKQGGVWIDTAYSSARSVTSVNRGSEQYRSLVADEPAIKQIADTLDGEIIVVWNGRTYRIH